MVKGSVSVDVPASSWVGCIWVDYDVSVGISLVGILSTREICLGCSGTVVDSNDERCWVRELGWTIDEHLNSRWVAAEVCDLLELPSGSKGSDCPQE